jgi:hypothetical protein
VLFRSISDIGKSRSLIANVNLILSNLARQGDQALEYLEPQAPLKWGLVGGLPPPMLEKKRSASIKDGLSENDRLTRTSGRSACQ